MISTASKAASARSAPELRLRAPAKINWTLSVLRRRPDGYHEIDSVFQAVSLFDELAVRAISKIECRIVCDEPTVPTDERNLIHRAWELLRGIFPERVRGIAVRLTKRIPSGAGLGGGSSDAAAALVAINRIYRLGIRRSTLAALGAEIGSDVPFFIHGGAARCRGRGEKIEPIRAKISPVDLVIVFPGFASPTGAAYAKLIPGDLGKDAGAGCVSRALAGGSLRSLQRGLMNTFDRLLAERDARYKKIKRAMREVGIVSPMLSGSGSACFGIARSRREAIEARDNLQREFEQVFAVRTIRSGIG